MSEENENTSAAARRRASKNRPTVTEAAVAAEVAPIPTPVAPVDPTRPVIVSRAMVAQYTNAATGGVTGARLPATEMSYGRPVAPAVVPVQPTSSMYGTVMNDHEYVTAQCDAVESMVPEGGKTPVSRLLWSTGWRVRRDLYEAVMAQTDPASQAANAVSPAKLPDGADAPPADMMKPEYRTTHAGTTDTTTERIAPGAPA